jgi:hypothetical protein
MSITQSAHTSHLTSQFRLERPHWRASAQARCNLAAEPSATREQAGTAEAGRPHRTWRQIGAQGQPFEKNCRRRHGRGIWGEAKTPNGQWHGPYGSV